MKEPKKRIKRAKKLKKVNNTKKGKGKKKGKRTMVRARGLEDNAAKKIQRFQTRKVNARSKEKQAYKDRFSRRVQVLRALEEKTEKYAPELIDKIFEEENFIKSPSPDIYDIPLLENANQINMGFGFYGIVPKVIRDWFGVHSVYHNDKVLGKQLTQREAQIKFALHNRQMKAYLKKLIRDGRLDETNMGILFPGNGEYAFQNNPWYVIYGILDNIEGALADQDYEAVYYYLTALNPDPPDIIELSPNIDTYFDIDDLDRFVGYLKRKIKEKQRELMPDAYRHG